MAFTLTYEVSAEAQAALAATVAGSTPEAWLRAQLDTLVGVQVQAHRDQEAKALGLRAHPKDLGLTDEEAAQLLEGRRAKRAAAEAAKAAVAEAAKAAVAEASAGDGK